MTDHTDETRPIIPPRIRNWLYPIALAVLALLGAYGIIDQSLIPQWIALVAGILGVGTAAAYRPSRTLK